MGSPRFYAFAFIGTLIGFHALSVAQNQVSEEWVARYDGPIDFSGLGYALGVDAEGNIYVAGSSYRSDTGHDYTTLKYTPQGQQLWVALYDGPECWLDEAFALALDAEGNAYVTGHSEGSDTLFDYATVKYSPHGEELWTARYNGPGNWMDEAFAVALDAEGNVYITGHSEGSDALFDCATVKYSQGTAPETLPADCNADGTLDLADAIFLLGYLFGVSTAVLPCGDGTVEDPANVALVDSNGDGGIDLADAIYVLSYLFAGTPAPVLGTQCVAIPGCPDACAETR